MNACLPGKFLRFLKVHDGTERMDLYPQRICRALETAGVMTGGGEAAVASVGEATACSPRAGPESEAADVFFG